LLFGKSGYATPDLGDDECIIAPLLFDVQVNGGFGIDLQSTTLTTDQVYALNDALYRQGVSSWLPTVVTDDIDAMEHKCRVLAQALEDPALAAHIPGIHLEGPHISPLDGPRGAHPAAHVIPPTVAALNRLYRAAKGRIACITLAPELPGAVRFIRAATERGVVVSLGHHAADTCHIEAAIGAGAKMCTHLGNGIALQLHRHHNGLWPQLADDRLHASFIADLQHIPPEALKVFARAKGAQRTILTSDSVFLTGMKPGKYDMFGAAVEMKKSGRICLSGTDLLAGSSLMLLQGVWNMYQHTDLTLEQAFASASTIPKTLFNMPTTDWPPKKGRKAMFIVCQPQQKTKKQSQLRIQALIHGNEVMRYEK
jgi:N-acetylglucosamine-6-phosphate deacetylase